MIIPRYLTNSYDIGHVVLWISSMLVSLMNHAPAIIGSLLKGAFIYRSLSFFQGGPQNQVQKQLNGLFSSIASFYHPSNNGRWLVRCSLLGITSKTICGVRALVPLKVQLTSRINSGLSVCVLSTEFYVCVQEGYMQWQRVLWQSEVTSHSIYWNTTNNFPVTDHLSR